MRLLRALKTRLADDRIVFWAPAIALLLTLPALRAGFIFDDFTHRIKVLGYFQSVIPRSAPTDLFAFVGNRPGELHRLVDRGLLPWFTYENFQLAFWRPLSSLTHYLDYSLWPESSALMHLQNMLWNVALVALVARAYRRFLGPGWVAGLAAMFYAVDDAHGMGVGWIADRNALISATFVLLLLLVHDRWRRDGWRPGAWLGPLFLALGLLSAEAAIAAGAYLFAHALCLDEGPLHRRFLRLWPYLAVVCLWRAVYVHLGYGALGAGNYIDLMREPRAFLSAASLRAPALLVGQLGLPPSNMLSMIDPGSVHGFVGLALLFLIAVAWLLTPLLRQSAVARFFAVGMVLAVVPICSVDPQDRLLYLVGLGGMGLVAQFLGALVDRPGWLPADRAWTTSAGVLGRFWIFVHGILAPIALPLSCLFLMFLRNHMEEIRANADLGPDIDRQTLVLVNAPMALTGPLFGAPKTAGEVVPARTRLLASSHYPVSVARTDGRTLVVRPEKGHIYESTSMIFRGPEYPMKVGQKIDLSDVTIEVTELTADGRPAEAAFHFKTALEDPSLRFLAWNGERYASFTPPKIGREVVLPAADFFRLAPPSGHPGGRGTETPVPLSRLGLMLRGAL